MCNGTLTFYSLPELSPVFTTNKPVSNCSWVGGRDLNHGGSNEETHEVIMICFRSRIKLVRISEELQVVRNNELPGCLTSARRGKFACVADAQSYALLDVENQQKISLFPISSQEENNGAGTVEDIPSTPDLTRLRNNSASAHLPLDAAARDTRGHGRSTSLGNLVGTMGRRQESPQPRFQDRLDGITPDASDRSLSPTRNATGPGSSADYPNNAHLSSENATLQLPERTSSLKGSSQVSSPLPSSLKPHICSPSSSEFLLTTGTSPTEPGVGIFVNLDGDVVRGTLEFGRYPSSVILDLTVSQGEDRQGNGKGAEGYVLATMTRPQGLRSCSTVEIQKLDGTSERDMKEWLDVPTSSSTESNIGNEISASIGLRTVNTPIAAPFPEVGACLRAQRLRISTNIMGDPDSDTQKESHLLAGWELSRNKDEADFAQRLGGQMSHNALWSGSSIWSVVKNPLAMRLDTIIDQALGTFFNKLTAFEIDRNKMIQIISSIRGQEATTETEFLSLEYIRQKISLILFCDFIIRSPSSSSIQNADKRITEGLLMEGGIDPRVVLTMIPLLREEIIEGPKGIWVHAGLIPVIERFWSIMASMRRNDEAALDFSSIEIVGILKRYLEAWRQRKGFGSIADEMEIFQTIEAAMLHLLLYHDSLHPRGISSSSSSRSELYSLVGSGLTCFDRAIILLEKYQRLYVLSRLYHSRKLAGKVLHTWTRIIEGEKDAGNELNDGENEIRKYLAQIKDPALVHDYGTWLAKRNPQLGIQVFTDDNSRVKLKPHTVIQLLREKAPEAVKVYLEYLVFGKKNFEYANDLIFYYLDNVLSVLESSDEARNILSQSNESYRALCPPKPTYRQFIVDNAVPDQWWHDRWRLLELLGGSHGTEFSYDVDSVLLRIEPFEQDLVPESIILDGRQGRHKKALRLLTHGLGDYHTAINYCLLGGASIFHPMSGFTIQTAAPSKDEQTILFGYLLGEFLRIEDIGSRLERTSELLERFGSWYDVSEVLDLVPETWSVDLISGYLSHAFRRLVQERNEAMITKALSSAENLQIASNLIETCSEIGPTIQGTP